MDIYGVFGETADAFWAAFWMRKFKETRMINLRGLPYAFWDKFDL